MNSISNSRVRSGVAVRTRRGASFRRKLPAAIAFGLAIAFAYAGHALAATATSITGGIGDQLNSLSSEAINSGSTAFGASCYLAGAISFLFGVWSFWQSRQPQNRESGYISRAIAGAVLCGVFTTGGVWINKAALSTSGGGVTINDAPAMVQFGAGG